MSRVLPVAIVATIVGAGIGGGVVAAWALLGAPTECVPSEPVANLITATPVLVVNSPYGGWANGTYTVFSNTSAGESWVQQSVGAKNGSVTYLYDVTNWTVWTTHREGKPVGSCLEVFAFTWAPTGSWIVDSTLENFTNDSRAPQSSGGPGGPDHNGSPLDPIYFNQSFSRAVSIGETCGSGAVTLTAGSRYIDLRIPFEYLGAPHVGNVTFDEFTNFSYTFPANGGAWGIDELSSPGGPGGGWAFSYLKSCA